MGLITFVTVRGSGAPFGLRGCKNRPAPFPRKRQLNQTLSVLSISLGIFGCVGGHFLRCVTSYYLCVLCHLVVLVRLSVPVQTSSPK